MNDLEKYFRANDGNMLHKWIHYFEAYDRHMSRYRGTDIHLLEFGVSHGGSLQMWKDYLGPDAKIHGVDINPHCKDLEEDQVEISIGDQADREFLTSLREKLPRIDVLIDDGGHTMEQQIATFEVLFDAIEPNGIYMCEDMHTSYWKDFGGGHRRPGTFIEYTKNLIDRINAWHSREPGFQVDDLTRSIHSLHWYDSVLVVEKRPMTEPVVEETGHRRTARYKPASGPRAWLKKLSGK